jgi:magnesium transporter
MHEEESPLSKSLQILPDPTVIAAEMASYHVADVVEALNALRPELAARVLENMPIDRVTDILEQPGFDKPRELIERLPLDRAATILGAMSADRRADIFRRLSEPVRVRLSSRLEPSIQVSLQRLLAYPPMSAGRIMTTEFVSMPATWTVEQALQHIREVGGARETVYALYILDPNSHQLLRAISLRQLILSDHATAVIDVGPPRRPITVSPLTDREEVARLISKYDLLAVPVIDDNGRVLGIVTVDDVIDAIVQEDTEDVQKFGGMEALDQPYMRHPCPRTARNSTAGLVAYRDTRDSGRIDSRIDSRGHRNCSNYTLAANRLF